MDESDLSLSCKLIVLYYRKDSPPGRQQSMVLKRPTVRSVGPEPVICGYVHYPSFPSYWLNDHKFCIPMRLVTAWAEFASVEDYDKAGVKRTPRRRRFWFGR